MNKTITVRPQRGVVWYTIVASSAQKLTKLAQAAEHFCMQGGVDCRLAKQGDAYPVEVLREGIFYTTVPCPRDFIGQLEVLQEPVYTRNRAQAHTASQKTYFARYPLREVDVSTNKPIARPPKPETLTPRKPINVIVQVPAEDEALIKEIARDLCKKLDAPTP